MDFLRGAGMAVMGAGQLVGGLAKDAHARACEALEAMQSQDRASDLGDLHVARRRTSSDVCAGQPDPPTSLTVLVGTWNVFGERIALADDFDEWLLSSGTAPDIVALGLQELVDLNPAHCVMKAGGDFEREDEFDARVLQSLGPHGCYFKVRSVGMVGLYLTCFARESLAKEVHGADADRIRTTAEGLAGKKGAVAIRFAVSSTSFCFVNAHLPSGQLRTEERSSALRQVMSEAFQSCNFTGGARPPKLGFKRESRHRIASHDCAFVFGDLNFRLTCCAEDLPNIPSELTAEECMALKVLDPSMFDLADSALAGFSEGAIDFPPTYKYKVGTTRLDDRRVPAWTDRIFYNGEGAELVQYRAHMGLRHTSDHRPVSAMFTAHLRAALAELHE